MISDEGVIMNKVPVLTPQDAEFLLKYFSGVANTLSKRFELGFQPDEEHLTSLLCELLDDRGAKLHSLDYSISDLNKDLDEIGSLLNAAVALKTTDYNKYQERYYTQADFGIILDYKDYIDNTNSFRKGLLIQAKKLFPAIGNQYQLSSCYKSFNAEQHDRYTNLRDHFNRLQNSDMNDNRMNEKMHKREMCYQAFQYLLYNPQLKVLPVREQERTLHKQINRESHSIFDYTHGLCLYENLKKPNAIRSILELSSFFVNINDVHSLAERAASNGRSKSNLSAFDLEALICAIDIRQRSFAWYLVFQFILGDIGCMLPEFLDLVSGNGPRKSNDLQFLPPRYVMHVTLSAGTNPEKEKTNTQQQH